MKKVFSISVLLLTAFLFSACSLLTPDNEEEANRIMTDIQAAFNSDDFDTCMYDFFDLFSDDAYKKFGDLDDTYAEIDGYLGGRVEKIDLIEADLNENKLIAEYQFQSDGKDIYIHFIADVSDSLHKRGIQYLNMADDLEAIHKLEDSGYGIFLNGKDILSYKNADNIVLKENAVDYLEQYNYTTGNEKRLAEKVADELVNNLKNKDSVKLKEMFSNAVWKYDSDLEEQINEFMERYSDLEIVSYEVSVVTSGGSTSSSYLIDSKGTNHPTIGHGNAHMNGDIILNTKGGGEYNIEFKIIMEYEPNPGRIGIWNLNDCVGL